MGHKCVPVTVGESSFYFKISIETASYLQRLLRDKISNLEKEKSL
jgi:hypothetical protein